MTEELKKPLSLVCADFIAVGADGKKPVTVEKVCLTTGENPDGICWTVVNAKTKHGWRT